MVILGEMLICHVSDTHWTTDAYPAADLYVFTGDHLRNFAFKVVRAYGSDWTIDPKVERVKQKLAMAEFAKLVGLRSFLGSPDAPIVCVRGNHDFVPIAPLFEGCNLVHEFVDNEVVSAAGLSITGHRGVPWIGGDRPGIWNDEVSRADLIARFKRMDPGCDLYVTHYPPSGVGLGEPYGLEEIDNWMQYNTEAECPMHLFGHIHEHGGQAHPLGRIFYSNAATTWNLIEGDPARGWRKVDA